MRIGTVLLVLIVGLSGSLYADGDIQRGKEAFEACIICHGENGEGGEDFGAPRLAGQYGWYLGRQLENFRAGIRGTHEDDDNGQIMQPMAEELKDQDIEDLIAYILTL